MRLKRVSAQGPESLETYFQGLAKSPHWQAYAEGMLRIIRHLELAVPGPDQWVTTSHHYVYMGSEDTWQPEVARVFISYRGISETLESRTYNIKYRSTKELNWDTSFTLLHAHDIEEAGRLVQVALQNAETDLLRRGL